MSDIPAAATQAIDLADIAILATIAALSAAFFYWRNSSAPKTPTITKTGASSLAASASAASKPGANARSAKKSLLEKIRSLGDGKHMLVFYGSQTGTAEDLATRTAREVSGSLGISAAVCDLEEFDMSELAKCSEEGVGSNILFLFFLATYGEGEPTDNAVDFYSWLMDGKGIGEDDGDEDDDMVFSRPLEGLSFFVFGLGNKTYEHFNAVGRRVDRRLEKIGAKRIHPRGEGDDDASLEEDFLNWKPKAIQAVADHFGITASEPVNVREKPHVPSFTITFPNIAVSSGRVFRGEHSADSTRSWKPRGPEAPEGYELLVSAQIFDESRPASSFDVKHPFYSRIVQSRPLFEGATDTFDFASSAPGATMPAASANAASPLWSVNGSCVTVPRQCYHVEFDLTGSGLKYSTGDHVGIWPENSPDEVTRLASELGVTADLDRAIDLEPNLENSLVGSKKPFPVPCTLRAALTCYLDLTEVLKQFHFEVLAKYADEATEREQLFRISEDRGLYVSIVDHARKNLADVLEDFKSIKIPLGVVLGEILSHTAVRYYSISSSSKEDPNKVAATAVVVRYAVASPVATASGVLFKKSRVVIKEGLATAWLQRQHMLRGQPLIVSNDGSSASGVPPLYVPLYIRSSNFHLPDDLSKPIVMVGPGTGVAPFRAFVRERVLHAREGKSVGPTWLFYGCRTRETDHLYRTEFEALESEVADKNLAINLRIVTAFSRETAKKVYVQHRLLEHKSDIWSLLDANHGNGTLYICGDAKHMATDVARALESISSEEGGLSEEDAKQWFRSLKTSGRFFEDVWG